MTASTTPTRPLLDPSHVPYRLAASYILSQLELHSIQPPKIGIICGSGLSNLSNALDNDDDDDFISSPSSSSSTGVSSSSSSHKLRKKLTIPYSSIPHFPSHCTVTGHAGELVVGTLHSIPTICFRGRFHSYEGHSMDTVVLPVKVMRCLGVQLVLVTNAAGGLKDNYAVGDVAVIRDHIALPLLAGKNPLVGPNDEELGPRFPPTSNLYDASLQDIVVRVATNLQFQQHLHLNATYAFVSGPQYESKSECAMLRLLGADAVGMSTVPEILAAHHAGMAVLCLSLITNKVVYFDEPIAENGKKTKKSIPVNSSSHANHEEVLQAVNSRGEQMVQLVAGVIQKIGEDYLPLMDELNPICLDTKGRVVGGNSANVDKKRLSLMTFCPYHMVKGVLSVPTHCLIMGGVLLAAGAVLGSRMGTAGAK
ncbi:hypothetical protein ACHAXH_006062 [Discostella pseudostelligera]